ncbi:MAG TPA: hypothetical protein VF154_03585 [Terriglobales bacterium]
MFARFLELNIQPGKQPELTKVLKNDVLPILKKWNGFLEMLPLDVETEPTKFYLLSLWHEKRHAEQFHRDHFPKVQAIYDPFLTAPITVKLGHVDETVSTRKFIAAAA